MAFADLLTRTWDQSDGRFLANVLAVAANDDHGILLVYFRFLREGQVRDYRTAHIVTFRDGRIATWEGHPGDEAEFEAAWGLEPSPSLAPWPAVRLAIGSARQGGWWAGLLRRHRSFSVMTIL